MEVSIQNQTFRDAVYVAFEGKCFYTGQPVLKDDMTIDHVVPLDKGGENNVYNYVLTSRRLNLQKNAKIDRDYIDRVLYIIRLVFVPKVLKEFKKRSGQRRRPGPRDSVWIKQRGKLKMLLWGMYYDTLRRNTGMTSQEIDNSVLAAKEMFGMSLPFYRETQK